MSARRCSATTPRRRSGLRAGLGAPFPGPLLPRAAARRPSASAKRWWRARWRSPRGSDLPVVATHPVQFLRRERLPGARSARLHRHRPRARRPAPAEALHARAVLQAPGRDGEAVRRHPARAARTRSRSRGAATSRSSSARAGCRRSRRPAGVTVDELPAARGRRRGLAQRFEKLGLQEADEPRYRERLEFEIRTIIQMGFAGYFLIVADFINWAKSQRRAGRARARLGRGLAGRLLARHHRPRSAASTTCCSSASSTRSACRCPTSTSTSARTGATG